MSRNAHVRVDRLAFLAKLEEALKAYQAYEAKKQKAQEKYDAEVAKWAEKVVRDGKFKRVSTSYRTDSLSIELSESVAKSAPKRPTLDTPDEFRCFNEREIKEVISLLKLSNEPDVSAYTYRDVTRYISS